MSIFFVYGTLMSPEICKLLIGRVPVMRAAVLPGYHCFNIKDRPYPAIAACHESKTLGNIVELSEAEVRVLDWYENSEVDRHNWYTRVTVNVTPLHDGPPLSRVISLSCSLSLSLSLSLYRESVMFFLSGVEVGSTPAHAYVRSNRDELYGREYDGATLSTGFFLGTWTWSVFASRSIICPVGVLRSWNVSGIFQGSLTKRERGSSATQRSTPACSRESRCKIIVLFVVVVVVVVLVVVVVIIIIIIIIVVHEVRVVEVIYES